MSLIEFSEIFLIAVALSMDAFAVSVCKGLALRRMSGKNAAVTGLYFGGFQFLMPLIGYLFCSRFRALITQIDHWIAFILLALIGGNMIKEALSEAEKLDDNFGPKTMLPLAVATSIDALAVGVSFALIDVKIVPACSLIGITTFALSVIGVKVGNVFGTKYKSKSEIVGGVILIIIGIKILLEGLGIIS